MYAHRHTRIIGRAPNNRLARTCGHYVCIRVSNSMQMPSAFAHRRVKMQYHLPIANRRVDKGVAVVGIWWQQAHLYPHTYGFKRRCLVHLLQGPGKNDNSGRNVRKDAPPPPLSRWI